MGHKETFGTDNADIDRNATVNAESINAFPDASGGVRTLINTNNYRLTQTVKTNTDGINFVDGATNQITTDNPLANILQSGVTGTDKFITGNITRVNILQTNVVSTANDGVCFDLSNHIFPGVFFINESTVQSFDNIGTLDSLSFSSENTGWFNNGSGLTLNDIGVVVMTDQNFALHTGDHLTFTGSLISGYFNNFIAAPSTGDALFNLDSALSITQKMVIRDNFFSDANGGTLFDSGGLDQTDPRIAAFNNGNEPNSCWTGATGFMGNATETELTQDVWADISGDYDSDDEHLERMNHDTPGVLESEALESYRAKVSVELSATNTQSAANRVIRIGIFTDIGSGFVERHSACFSIDGNIIPLSFSQILKDRFELGHKVKARILNTTNNDNATVIDINVKVERQD